MTSILPSSATAPKTSEAKRKPEALLAQNATREPQAELLQRAATAPTLPSIPDSGNGLITPGPMLLEPRPEKVDDTDSSLNEKSLSESRRAAQAAGPVGGVAKRACDIAIAGTALVLLSPLLLVVAILVRRNLGLPIIYSHSRVGRFGEPFRCYKFRTMVNNSKELLEQHLAENPEAALEWKETHKLKNDPRITPLGRVLRRTSIDELPQLVNVLMGQMSCVGPRPVVTEELVAKYGVHARHYLRARPGLTGVWQVHGRSSTSYRQRVAMDTLYIRRYSILRDFWLLVKTVSVVVSAKDAV